MAAGAARFNDTDLLSQLVGRIYDCAIEPSGWSEAIARIREALSFCNGMLTIWKLPTGTVLLNVTSGIEPGYAAQLPTFSSEVVEQWGGAQRIAGFPVGEPQILSRERRNSDWRSGRYYSEWVEPQGISDMMAMPVTRDSDTYCSVGFARHHRDGTIGRREIDLMRLLAPHIQRAVAISRLLDIQSLKASTFSATLDTLTAGVFIVDEDLGIVSANAVAQAMLEQHDCVASQGGALRLGSAGASAALRAAVAQADEAGIGRRGMGIPLIRADGSPALAQVLPLRHGPLRAGLVPSASAAVFIAPATGAARPSTDAVAGLFDLTPAETRVFASVAGGRTLMETAEALGVGVGTVRTHLARIFTKTGTHRQAELVRLAASLVLVA